MEQYVIKGGVPLSGEVGKLVVQRMQRLAIFSGDHYDG